MRILQANRPAAYHLPMKAVGSIFRCVFAATSIVAAPAALAQTSGVQEAAFVQAPPYANTFEIVKRMFSPLTAQKIIAEHLPSQQPLDISQEKYLLYVPSHKPSEGYGLLVFVPPSPNAALPKGWAAIFDTYGVIYVCASNSGNATDVLFRRVPLALAAAYNLTKAYSIDPSRVLIGGFSGGARVALRTALAYPDVFRGALMNSGGDAFGTLQRPLPSRDLFRRFQQDTRLYFLSGDGDIPARDSIRDTLQSLRDWCVPDTQAVSMLHTGHQPMDPEYLAGALQALLAPAVSTRDDATCMAGRDREIDDKLRQADALVATGDKEAARRLVDSIDSTYGGLAAPHTIALDAQLH